MPLLGLKACIASQVAADTVPSKEMLKGFLDHDFRKLVGLAGLAAPLKQQQASDIQFAAYWAVVSEWSPDARYEATDRMSAQVLLDAIGNPNSGVLAWIRRYW